MADESPELAAVRLTDTQRAILVALCRPRAGGNRYATAATNQEIAGEVFLSVDAVKAHLRALYRKFGVEPLPHNQKRARLVELVMEGELIPLVEGDGDGGPGTVEPEPRSEAPAPLPAAEPSRSRRRASGRLVALGAALTGAVALLMILTGTFSSDSSGGSAEEFSTPAAYRADVNDACRLALEGQSKVTGTTIATRARGYLGVIATMRDRLDALAPPPGDNQDLALFRTGLGRAADYTSLIALGPPPPGSHESANAVAQLTLAAGQVQAGALGYGLGRNCSAIGSVVVAGSARNAAVSP